MQTTDWPNQRAPGKLGSADSTVVAMKILFYLCGDISTWPACLPGGFFWCSLLEKFTLRNNRGGGGTRSSLTMFRKENYFSCSARLACRSLSKTLQVVEYWNDFTIKIIIWHWINLKWLQRSEGHGFYTLPSCFLKRTNEIFKTRAVEQKSIKNGLHSFKITLGFHVWSMEFANTFLSNIS